MVHRDCKHRQVIVNWELLQLNFVQILHSIEVRVFGDSDSRIILGEGKQSILHQNGNAVLEIK